MKYYITKSGYCYIELKSGKKKRISKDKYLKLSKSKNKKVSSKKPTYKMYKSKNGYFYKELKNGKRKRISKDEYFKSTKIIPYKKKSLNTIAKGGATSANNANSQTNNLDLSGTWITKKHIIFKIRLVPYESKFRYLNKPSDKIDFFEIDKVELVNSSFGNYYRCIFCNKWVYATFRGQNRENKIKHHNKCLNYISLDLISEDIKIFTYDENDKEGQTVTLVEEAGSIKRITDIDISKITGESNDVDTWDRRVVGLSYPVGTKVHMQESSKLNISERHQLAKNLAQSVGQVPE
tara:strand:+ start:178 stop:1056 length:879 start_codon:yes stop_codon:yes gene_type:complete